MQHKGEIHMNEQADSEERTVLDVQGGDLEAFGRLMDLHVRRLRTFIALRAPVPHLIDEIAHDTFVYAYHNINRFQAGTSFFAWIRAVAENLLRAEVQRYSREQVNQMNYVEYRLLERASSDEMAGAGTDIDHLEECLGQVPPPLRELLDLKYKFAYSAGEIADALSRSLAWVRTTLCRVRKQLRECIQTKAAAREQAAM
jgi:RNA polymerase sigma-70 factor (ECF subfamily)